MQILKDAAVPYLAVLTKCDKATGGGIVSAQASILGAIAESAAAYPYVLNTSASKGEGFTELRALLAKILYPKAVEA